MELLERENLAQYIRRNCSERGLVFREMNSKRTASTRPGDDGF